MSISICVLVVALLTSIQEEVLAQVLPYGGAPIPYIDNEDDDLEMLLTILLLVGRNKNSGCGCCQCCCSPKNIPLPFPIPIATNNPIVNKGDPEYDDYDETPKEKSKKDKKNIIIKIKDNDH